MADSNLFDVEAELNNLDANPQFDQDLGPESDTERWLFPRRPGLDKIGTCSAKAKTHAGTHQSNEACKKFEVDPAGMYLSRAGIAGHDTDVELVASWLDAPRSIVGAVYLRGEPGTGKTTLAEAAATHAGRTMLTHMCTPDDTRESLFLRFVGEGKGEGGTPFMKGVLPRAVESGLVLNMDEVLLLVDGVKPILYELADGRPVLSGGNVDGTDLPVHPDFRLMFSSNPQVRGASLPEPLASRCAGTTLTVETSEGLMRDLGIGEDLISAWVGLGAQNLWRPQLREMRVANYWADADPQLAVAAMIPEHCPASEREAVRAALSAFIGGGDIRNDGRLVVA